MASGVKNPKLRDLFADHNGKTADKWSLYLDIYEHLFSSIRNKPVRLLEIGVQNGGSLEIWRKYFSRAQIIVGCDVNPDCSNLRFDNDSIRLVIGDANSDEAFHSILSLSTEFDIIIDDGSHKSSDIVKSFSRFFGRLSAGGHYIVEDLHCSYWRDYEGGFNAPYSSMSFFKRLADVVNQEHWGVHYRRIDALGGFQNEYLTSFSEEVLASIHSIQFANSFCAIRRLPSAQNELGRRKVAGQQAIVSGRHMLALNHTTSTPADQTANPWSPTSVALEDELAGWLTRAHRSEEALSNVLANLVEKEAEITSINKKLAQFHDEQGHRHNSERHAEYVLEGGLEIRDEQAKVIERQADEVNRLATQRNEQGQQLDAISGALRAAQDGIRDSQSDVERLVGELTWVKGELARSTNERIHLLSVAKERCDRIAVLNRDLGAVQSLLNDSQSQTQRLCAALEAGCSTSALRDRGRDAQMSKTQLEQLRATLIRQAQAIDALAPQGHASPTTVWQGLKRRFARWWRPELRQIAWEADVIRASRMFGALEYLTRYPDVVAAGTDPLMHYLRYGAVEGRSPYPLFDSKFYLKQYPEAAAAKMSALAHYASAGVAAGFDPHPLFDTDWYLQQNPDVAAIGINPLHHFVTQGWREGRDPHPLFDTSFYMEQNPDVAAAGENPLVHYCVFGWKQGRDPHPDFDTSWYLEQNGDVAEKGVEPLAHYVMHGKSEGRPAVPSGIR